MWKCTFILIIQKIKNIQKLKGEETIKIMVCCLKKNLYIHIFVATPKVSTSFLFQEIHIEKSMVIDWNLILSNTIVNQSIAAASMRTNEIWCSYECKAKRYRPYTEILVRAFVLLKSAVYILCSFLILFNCIINWRVLGFLHFSFVH